MSDIGIKSIPLTAAFPDARFDGAGLKTKENFGDFLLQALGDIDKLQNDAGQAQELLARGEAGELHQVMIAAEKAGISFDLLLEIRKKLLEAYQDLIRMQV